MNNHVPCCTRGDSRADVRRRKLIETARKLFIENGFHATGIAQIAQQSGIAVGQIYRDFSSKEEIVAGLVREDCARFMTIDVLNEAIRHRDARAVHAWLLHFVEADDDIEGDRLFAEIVAESARNERIASIFTTLQDELRGNMLAALALLAPGDDNTAQRVVVADSIMTMSLGLLHHRLFRPSLAVEPLVRALQSLVNAQIEALGCKLERAV